MAGASNNTDDFGERIWHRCGQVAVVNAAAAIDEVSNKAHESKVAFDAAAECAASGH